MATFHLEIQDDIVAELLIAVAEYSNQSSEETVEMAARRGVIEFMKSTLKIKRNKDIANELMEEIQRKQEESDKQVDNMVLK